MTDSKTVRMRARLFLLMVCTVVIPEIQSASAQTRPKPEVTRISPDNGAVAGGTRVTITGKNFQTSPRPKVKFGSNSALDVLSPTATSLVAITPAIDPRKKETAVEVVVENADGTKSSGGVFSKKFSFVVPAPSISSATQTLNSLRFSGRDLYPLNPPGSTIKVTFPATPSGTAVVNASVNLSRSSAEMTIPRNYKKGSVSLTIETLGGKIKRDITLR